MRGIKHILFLFFFITLGTYAIPSIRYFNQPIPVFVFPPLLIIYLYESFTKKRKVSLVILLALSLLIFLSFFSALINIPHNLQKVMNLALFLSIFYLILSFLSGTDLPIKIYLRILFISTIFIFIYGIYGFFNWNVGEYIQHTFGYFGITYTTATRNGDMMFLFIPFWYSLLSLLFKSESLFIRFFYASILFLISLGIIFSFARGAWIALFLTFIILVVVSFLKKNRPAKLFFRKLFIFFMFFVFFGITILPQEIRYFVSSRFASIFNADATDEISSNSARKDIFQKSYNIILNNPLFGIGAGNTSKYLTYEDGETANHAENMFLTILIELGIFGLSVFILLLYLYFYKYNQLTSLHFDFYVYYSIAIFSTFIFYGIFNLMIDSLWFWVNLGISYSLLFKANNHNLVNKNLFDVNS